MQGGRAAARVAVSCAFAAACLSHFHWSCCANMHYDATLGSLQKFIAVSRRTVRLNAGGLCRSFLRAGGAGEELGFAVLSKLLEVLSAGNILVLADHPVLRICMLTLVLPQLLGAACHLVSLRLLAVTAHAVISLGVLSSLRWCGATLSSGTQSVSALPCSQQCARLG